MIRDLVWALQQAVDSFRRNWAFARHMRRGGNPDHLPF